MRFTHDYDKNLIVCGAHILSEGHSTQLLQLIQEIIMWYEETFGLEKLSVASALSQIINTYISYSI